MKWNMPEPAMKSQPDANYAAARQSARPAVRPPGRLGLRGHVPPAQKTRHCERSEAISLSLAATCGVKTFLSLAATCEEIATLADARSQ